MTRPIHTVENTNARSQAELTVRAMFDAVCAGDEARFRELWAEDAVWDNVPVKPVRGREQIVRFWKPFLRKPGSFRADLVHVATFAGVVHTERVDYIEIRGMKMTAKVAGIFEVQGGQIVANREYWDALSIGLDTLRRPLLTLLGRD